MKKYRILLAATLGCALVSPMALAASPAADKAGEELRAVLKQHHEALNKHDIKALMALYADTPEVALMGTGPGEFWKGKAEMEGAYKHYFETFKAGSLSHECPEASGDEQGSSAWLMASCVMKDTDPAGKPREFGLNVSAVLKKEAAGWRFEAVHVSNVVSDGGAPPEGAAAPKKAE